MNLQGAIFDVDGTLLDSMPIWDTVGADYLRAQGITPRPGLRRAICTMSLRQTAAYFRREYGLTQREEEIMAGIDRMLEHFYGAEARPKPGVLSFLEGLRQQGVKMAVATATDRYLVEMALERNGMLPYFQGIFTCTEVGAGKEKPDVFFKALAALGTPMEATPVFEDAYYAAATAKAAGFPVVAVYDPSGAGEWARLQQLADKSIFQYGQLER